MMVDMIQEKLNDLVMLCKKYEVQKMYLFGSAAGENFKPQESDIDFLVTFKPMTCQEHADVFFGLHEELERLFNSAVDLIEEKPIRNPYFKEELEQTKVELYAA